jgi:hypothetical protein
MSLGIGAWLSEGIGYPLNRWSNARIRAGTIASCKANCKLQRVSSGDGFDERDVTPYPVIA